MVCAATEAGGRGKLPMAARSGDVYHASPICVPTLAVWRRSGASPSREGGDERGPGRRQTTGGAGAVNAQAQAGGVEAEHQAASVEESSERAAPCRTKGPNPAGGKQNETPRASKREAARTSAFRAAACMLIAGGHFPAAARMNGASLNRDALRSWPAHPAHMLSAPRRGHDAPTPPRLKRAPRRLPGCGDRSGIVAPLQTDDRPWRECRATHRQRRATSATVAPGACATALATQPLKRRGYKMGPHAMPRRATPHHATPPHTPPHSMSVQPFTTMS